MFNLEQAIIDWRRQMLAAGIQSPVPLEELESHLREDVEQLTRSGLNARRAFELATQQIGQPRALKSEFARENTNMKRTITIIATLILIAVGMAFVTPALGQYQHEGALSQEEMFLLPLGILICLAGVGTGVWGFKKRRA